MSIVEFRNVTKRFGSQVVLRDLDVSIVEGEVVVVIGPSGSGKSTFLRCINVLEPIDTGQLKVVGIDATGGRGNALAIRRETGMVFQQFNLFPHMTAAENVAFGPRRARAVPRRRARGIAIELLEKVGLGSRVDYYPHELSGGQQQRVAIARSLAVSPRLMLFDEPTSALDPELRYEVLQVMRDLAREGMTMIVVTHEMSFAREVGTRILYMNSGVIAADGSPQEILGHKGSPQLNEFLRHVNS